MSLCVVLILLPSLSLSCLFASSIQPSALSEEPVRAPATSTLALSSPPIVSHLTYSTEPSKKSGCISDPLAQSFHCILIVKIFSFLCSHTELRGKYILLKLDSTCRALFIHSRQWLSSDHFPDSCISVTCYFDIHVVIQQEIFSLQVTVHNLPAMAIINSRQNLPEFSPSFRFI